MKEINETIKSMDLEYFAKGSHKVTFDKMMELKKEDKVCVLDVRSKEETECVNIPFAINIPLHEVPDRLAEIPKDKTIAVFCFSATRAAIVLPFLLAYGYDAKIILETIGELASSFKPDYVYKNMR